MVPYREMTDVVTLFPFSIPGISISHYGTRPLSH